MTHAITSSCPSGVDVAFHFAGSAIPVDGFSDPLAGSTATTYRFNEEHVVCPDFFNSRYCRYLQDATAFLADSTSILCGLSGSKRA